MALRAVTEHPKFARLKLLLRAPKGATLGWLEATWHFAAKFTPAGNVGKYDDSEIEAWVEWDGEPGALIDALVQSKWLDKDGAHRLIIHDWHTYADSFVHTDLARRCLTFANGALPNTGRLNQAERQRFHDSAVGQKQSAAAQPELSHESAAAQPELSHESADEQLKSATSPKPEPEPEPEPNTTATQKRRGCRLPEDFAVTEEHRKFARDHGLASPEAVIDEFKDFWVGVPGARGLKLDWNATFRNRMREKTKQIGGQNGRNVSRTSANQAALEEFRERRKDC